MLFFPAAMVLVGAHYLPFVFLYGMRSFLLLAIPMVVMGVGIGLYFPTFSVVGAWFTVGLLLAFGAGAFVAGRRMAKQHPSRRGWPLKRTASARTGLDTQHSTSS